MLGLLLLYRTILAVCGQMPNVNLGGAPTHIKVEFVSYFDQQRSFSNTPPNSSQKHVWRALHNTALQSDAVQPLEVPRGFVWGA